MEMIHEGNIGKDKIGDGTFFDSLSSYLQDSHLSIATPLHHPLILKVVLSAWFW